MTLIFVLFSCTTESPKTLDVDSAPILSDLDNFQYEASIAIPTFELTELQDAQLNWSDIETDLLGLPVEASEINEALLSVWGNMTASELENAVAIGQLPQENIRLFVSCTPQDAQCALSDFGLLGNDADVEARFVIGDDLWMLTLLSEDSLTPYRRIMFLEPSETAAASASFLPRDEQLIIETDLSKMTPIRIPTGVEVEFDWSQIQINGNGAEIEAYRLDTFFIGHFIDSDLETLSTRFTELESLANRLWEFPVTEPYINLLNTEFEGFTTDGIWVLGIRCSTCYTPMPQFLTLLKPTDVP